MQRNLGIPSNGLQQESKDRQFSPQLPQLTTASCITATLGDVDIDIINSMGTAIK